MYDLAELVAALLQVKQFKTMRRDDSKPVEVDIAGLGRRMEPPYAHRDS
jgi:hypothetical protein